MWNVLKIWSHYHQAVILNEGSCNSFTVELRVGKKINIPWMVATCAPQKINAYILPLEIHQIKFCSMYQSHIYMFMFEHVATIVLCHSAGHVVLHEVISISLHRTSKLKEWSWHSMATTTANWRAIGSLCYVIRPQILYWLGFYTQTHTQRDTPISTFLLLAVWILWLFQAFHA